ncbi:fatty acid--CoA ligase family protein [Lysinibacillus sphaericus]|uniref:Long chain fatty acid-CoA ligase n=2 Tax=Lysinibacillus TaxID=400634 RepID=A0A2S0JWL9_LYSSH|nr:MULTISPECIES: fatty acid--CoA ligase family protein [Lysinibacillus]AVK95532.1 long-chain fatty acid--CoA ligase [Lysinibacillus sphaericus]MCS1384345.1 fatty acid--CoA ligase family protein [Lysinibacillus sphaericus]MED4542814.1 fatty acid--CoA ligase family protein [Lysinibacillus sphaericus]TKI19472.1 fatty acid--CoA ligase family protein [Lysinibacillus sphaericus]TKI46301.1 fatty acid--CoA ligase family protein [Lysinibacillus tabacifolii]
MNLVSCVRQQAAEQPEKIAYHFMGKDTSYGEFEHTVGRFAQGLQDLGVQKGDHVAFLLGNTPHYLIALYATMRLGATAIPVNPIYTPDEISYILRNGDVKAVIALDALLPLVEVGVQAFPEVVTFVVCETTADVAEKIAALSEEAKAKTHLFSHIVASATGSLEPVDIAQDDTAIILYTSGTTGNPKGAMLTHGNVYSNARDVSTYLGYRANDRIIATLPVFHVFALTVVVNAPLISGATVLLTPRFSPSEIFTLAREQQATVFAGVPTMYNFLYLLPEGKPEDFSTIRLAISGGASLPVALLHNFEKKFNVRVSEGYGLSEASPVTCFNPLDRERKAGSIGTSINNVENRVVDVNGIDVPVGEVGELVVRGPNVMKGYYKMPEETAMAIRDGWLYTGDLAKVDDEGYFYIVDRKKDMIIVGGYNVYPREVEEVLFAHDNIVEAAVVGYPDPNFGEAVHAYIVLKEVAATTTDDILAYCAKHMVKYKVPKVVEILDELPKNTTGKILRRTLKEKV